MGLASAPVGESGDRRRCDLRGIHSARRRSKATPGPSDSAESSGARAPTLEGKAWEGEMAEMDFMPRGERFQLSCIEARPGPARPGPLLRCASGDAIAVGKRIGLRRCRLGARSALAGSARRALRLHRKMQSLTADGSAASRVRLGKCRA